MPLFRSGDGIEVPQSGTKFRKSLYFATMNRFRRILGVLLIIIGPILIFFISTKSFDKVRESYGLLEALPWLLAATVIIPIGMSIAVLGFLCIKGEFD